MRSTRSFPSLLQPCSAAAVPDPWAAQAAHTASLHHGDAERVGVRLPACPGRISLDAGTARLPRGMSAFSTAAKPSGTAPGYPETVLLERPCCWGRMSIARAMRLVGDILGGPWWCIAQFPDPFSYQTWDAARFAKKQSPPMVLVACMIS